MATPGTRRSRRVATKNEVPKRSPRSSKRVSPSPTEVNIIDEDYLRSLDSKEDVRNMKVAELKRSLVLGGVKFPSTLRKAELQEMLLKSISKVKRSSKSKQDARERTQDEDEYGPRRRGTPFTAKTASTVSRSTRKKKSAIARKLDSELDPPADGLEIQQLENKTVLELKEILRENNLKVTGRKPELIERVAEFVKSRWEDTQRQDDPQDDDVPMEDEVYVPTTTTLLAAGNTDSGISSARRGSRGSVTLPEPSLQRSRRRPSIKSPSTTTLLSGRSPGEMKSKSALASPPSAMQLSSTVSENLQVAVDEDEEMSLPSLGSPALHTRSHDLGSPAKHTRSHDPENANEGFAELPFVEPTSSRRRHSASSQSGSRKELDSSSSNSSSDSDGEENDISVNKLANSEAGNKTKRGNISKGTAKPSRGRSPTRKEVSSPTQKSQRSKLLDASALGARTPKTPVASKGNAKATPRTGPRSRLRRRSVGPKSLTVFRDESTSPRRNAVPKPSPADRKRVSSRGRSKHATRASENKSPSAPQRKLKGSQQPPMSQKGPRSSPKSQKRGVSKSPTQSTRISKSPTPSRSRSPTRSAKTSKSPTPSRSRSPTRSARSASKSPGGSDRKRRLSQSGPKSMVQSPKDESRNEPQRSSTSSPNDQVGVTPDSEVDVSMDVEPEVSTESKVPSSELEDISIPNVGQQDFHMQEKENSRKRVRDDQSSKEMTIDANEGPPGMKKAKLSESATTSKLLKPITGARPSLSEYVGQQAPKYELESLMKHICSQPINDDELYVLLAVLQAHVTRFDITKLPSNKELIESAELEVWGPVLRSASHPNSNGRKKVKARADSNRKMLNIGLERSSPKSMFAAVESGFKPKLGQLGRTPAKVTNTGDRFGRTFTNPNTESNLPTPPKFGSNSVSNVPAKVTSSTSRPTVAERLLESITKAKQTDTFKSVESNSVANPHKKRLLRSFNMEKILGEGNKEAKASGSPSATLFSRGSGEQQQPFFPKEVSSTLDPKPSSPFSTNHMEIDHERPVDVHYSFSPVENHFSGSSGNSELYKTISSEVESSSDAIAARYIFSSST